MICIDCKQNVDDSLFQKCRNQCNSCRYKQRKLKNKVYSISVIEKECFKCKKVLPANRFYPHKRLATGLQTNCKECHKEKVRKQYETRGEKIRKKVNEYYHTNKEEIMPKRLEYNKKKVKSDPKFLLIKRLRNRLYYALLKKSWKKNTHFADYIGCTLDELKLHIEKQFKDGMSWENQGLWHLDHIIPLSSANTEEELYKLCHYTNIQPLWAEENLSKSNKIPA